jgi:hypothetical protein
MMIKLPRDVREKINAKRRRRIIAFLLTEAAFLLVMALFGELLFGALREYSDTLFYLTLAVVLVLPVFIVGLPKQRSDKDFYGVITDVHVNTRPVHKSDLGNGRPNSAKFNAVNFVELTVKTDKGDVDFIEIDVGVAKPEHFLGDYKIGFMVYHFAGLDGYLVIDPERDDLAYCVVCGGRESSDKVRCNHCGHTLVKFNKEISR